MSAALDRLINVMTQLRDPKTGCPWDLEQNFKSIAPYTIEETYEVVEAIEADDTAALKDELGDLLFQVIFHAQIGRDAGLFDIDQIANHVADKMIERHPHVFGNRDAATPNDVLTNWESDKAAKRKDKADAAGQTLSALDGVSTALPAATRAVKLQKRAARVGFDWSNPSDVINKIREELDELQAEMAIGKTTNADAMEDEFGDVLFALTNLARHLDIDPETALRRTNRKFERRFRAIEIQLAAHGKKIEDATLTEMETIWSAVKAKEKAAKSS